MPSCCLECKPCNGMPALFKSRHPTLQLRRALGKMKKGASRRRAGSSVRAVFWPLMSIRSDVDVRNDVAVDRPPSSSTDGSGSGARVPSPSLDNDTPGAASTTAARVLTLHARLGETAAPLTTVVGARDVDDVEEACRSFEKHLIDMLVEERKVMDLTDVEELLCCWEKLRCPAFVQLVGRFYGELCMDLFSGVSSESEDFTI
ncbi:uncharacterized protein LOC133889998 [Phragmites australis]|uniref:uncharacterized protein LOC133889998 n=1 Tax=Phragmites australis TaxID=29695 RepID=UPI002D78A94C|nr:uncharacterized protein LOC133889998 [Phragmites australis]